MSTERASKTEDSAMTRIRKWDWVEVVKTLAIIGALITSSWDWLTGSYATKAQLAAEVAERKQLAALVAHYQTEARERNQQMSARLEKFQDTLTTVLIRRGAP